MPILEKLLCAGKAYIYRDPEISSLSPGGEAAEYDDGDICDQGKLEIVAFRSYFVEV